MYRKGDRVVRDHLQLATEEYASRVAVSQDGQQSGWVICLGAPTRVLAGQIREVKPINDFNNEARQVIFREPVIHRRGEQVVSFTVGGNEVGHGQN
jgi:hypothetical protein